MSHIVFLLQMPGQNGNLMDAKRKKCLEARSSRKVCVELNISLGGFIWSK